MVVAMATIFGFNNAINWLCLGMTNDTNFILLQEELNAPISRPLRPNFATGPPFLTKFGGPQPLNGRGRQEREVGIDRTN